MNKPNRTNDAASSLEFVARSGPYSYTANLRLLTYIMLVMIVLIIIGSKNAYAGEKKAAADKPEEVQRSTNTSELLKKMLAKKSMLTVAVMPMENISVNDEVSYYYRQRVIELLVSKGYTVIDSAWIDNGLVKLGLTHAGQLRLLGFEQLKKIVNADAYVFGIVEEARTQHALAYNAYVYKSSIKMDNNQGENLWYSLEQRVSKRRIAIDPINALIDIVLVKKGGQAKQAVGALADRLLDSLPKGPSQVIIGDDLLGKAVQLKN